MKNVGHKLYTDFQNGSLLVVVWDLAIVQLITIVTKKGDWAKVIFTVFCTFLRNNDSEKFIFCKKFVKKCTKCKTKFGEGRLWSADFLVNYCLVMLLEL